MEEFKLTVNHEQITELQRFARESVELDLEWGGEQMRLKAQGRFEARLHAFLTKIADRDFADRYLAHPLPRPPIEAILKPRLHDIAFTVLLPRVALTVVPPKEWRELSEPERMESLSTPDMDLLRRGL